MQRRQVAWDVKIVDRNLAVKRVDSRILYTAAVAAMTGTGRILAVPKARFSI